MSALIHASWSSSMPALVWLVAFVSSQLETGHSGQNTVGQGGGGVSR